MTARTRILLAALADLLLVGLFVVIGRASHREDQSALFVTVWPFAAGLAVGWLVARAWRRPTALLHAGVPAWLGTVAVGMLLRALVGQGVQVAFVIVATIVVGVFLLGWRALLGLVERRRTRHTAAA